MRHRERRTRVKRASLGLSVLGIAALALGPLTLTAPAQAVGAATSGPAAQAGQHGPDPTFTPQERRNAIAAAEAPTRPQTARELHASARRRRWSSRT